MQKDMFKFEKRIDEGFVDEAEFLSKFLSVSQQKDPEHPDRSFLKLIESDYFKNPSSRRFSLLRFQIFLILASMASIEEKLTCAGKILQN